MPGLRYWEGNKFPGFYSRKYGIQLYITNLLQGHVEKLPSKTYKKSLSDMVYFQDPGEKQRLKLYPIHDACTYVSY